jgi:4-hydroxy-3-methylbut-2-enyl diphosphate reductase
VEQVPAGSRVGVICQSTLLQEKFTEFLALLKARCSEVVAINTICQPTKSRQNAVKQLAAEVDVMVVIGGYNSSNTKKLAAVACEILPPADVHHIETAAELQESWLEGKQHVGISAGASTPDYLIQEVVARIQSLGDAEVTRPAGG